MRILKLFSKNILILVLLLSSYSTINAQGTVDLSTHVTGTPPAGTTVRWFATTPPPTNTTPLTAAQIAAAPDGVYYVAYFDGTNSCYSPASKVVVASNVCPATTVNLNNRTSGTAPSGAVQRWYTSATPSTGTQVTNPAAVGAGTYYSFYYDISNNCYSPISAPVIVTIAACPQPDVNAGLVNKPIPGSVATNDNVPAGTTFGTPVASGSNPAGASITMNPDGTYNFTATTPGVYTYNVPVCAPGQVAPCPTQPLVITVTDPAVTNNPPIANTDIATTPNNTPVTVPILANDGVGNTGGTLGTPTITGGTNAGATATINGSGQLVYTPAPGFVGKDTIYYQVCESPSGVCVTSSAIITVDPPSAVNSTVASDDYVTTTGTTPATGNLKTNDSDPQGNTQTVTAQGSAGSPITIAGKGTYYINSDGTYSFTPVAGFSGTVDIPYTTCDNGAPQACTQASLHIVVRPASTLPITLHSFVAFANNCTANLSWATAVEINADRFEVEVSTDNSAVYNNAGAIAVSGTSSNYHFEFAMQPNVQYLFRLKMIDRDGTFKYSEIRRLTCKDGKQVITLVPNPVKDKFVIAGMEKGNNKVIIYNAGGQQLSAITITGSQGYVDITKIPSGIYMVRIISNTGSISNAKIIKQ